MVIVIWNFFMTFIWRCNHRRSLFPASPMFYRLIGFNINSTYMKTRITLFVLLVALLYLSASGKVADIMARLGLDHASAKSYLLANVTGSFSADYEVGEAVYFFPRIKTLTDIVAGDEVGAAKELCQYVRNYVNSQEFLDEYLQKRADSKPTFEPEPMNAESLESMRSSISEMETQLAELKKSPVENEQMIAMFQPMVVSQKASLAEYEDPTPNNTKWEKNYPADPAILVRRKLQNYLELVATVDFNAQLTAPDKYRIRKFVDPAYEGKSAHWKVCYRAGKEVNAEVTDFVKDWLGGEIIAAVKTNSPGDDNTTKAVSGQDAAATNPASQGTAPETDENSKANTVQETSKASKEKTSLLGKLKKAKNLINN